MVREELLASQGELRGSKEELRAANDELRDKIALLDGARRETSEAVSSAECLTEECRGLRGDLHQQITLVAQQDEVIGRLRDEAVWTRLCIQVYNTITKGLLSNPRQRRHKTC